jgi:hypothetical protein
VLHNNAGLLDTQLTDQLRLDLLPTEVWDRISGRDLRVVRRYPSEGG